MAICRPIPREPPTTRATCCGDVIVGYRPEVLSSNESRCSMLTSRVECELMESSGNGALCSWEMFARWRDFSVAIMYNIQHTDTYICIVSHSSSSNPPVLCRMIVEPCLGWTRKVISRGFQSRFFRWIRIYGFARFVYHFINLYGLAIKTLYIDL